MVITNRFFALPARAGKISIRVTLGIGFVVELNTRPMESNVTLVLVSATVVPAQDVLGEGGANPVNPAPAAKGAAKF